MAAAGLLLVFFFHTSAHAGLTSALQSIAANTWVTRSIRMADFGIDSPVVLDLRNSQRDFYLPVPANVALKDASLRIKVDYLLATQDDNSLVLSLDGIPMAARAFKGQYGQSVIDVAVDDAPRPSGFVHLGARWSAAIAAPACTDISAIGDLVKIDPDSTFTYRYDSAAIRDLNGAWSAMPPAPVILVAANHVSSSAYDTAWRIGATLLHMGRRPVFRAMPRVGDEVDLGGVKVPAELTAMPAFAALAKGGVQRLGNAAQVGALLLLGERNPLRADIVIEETALREQMTTALAALEAEAERSGRDAAAALHAWAARANSVAMVASALAEAGQVRVATLAGQPVIAVTAGAGAQAANLFRNFQLGLDGTDAVKLRTAKAAIPSGTQNVPLTRLGAAIGTIDLTSRVEWNTNFRLSDVAGSSFPTKAVLDVSVAPSSRSVTTVMSVFLNGILLGTKHLSAKGERERLVLRIPPWAVGARNALNVVLQRQALSADCNTPLETVPASILPGSHLVFAPVKLQDDFTGMVTRFGSGAELIVPSAYLDDAPRNLARVVYVADAAGVSPERATTSFADDLEKVSPHSAFLAFELPANGMKQKAVIEGARLVLPPGAKRVGMDIDGLAHVAVLEVSHIKMQTGILYRNVGNDAPQFAKPFQLSRGDVAVVGAGGLLTEIDIEGRDDGRLVASSEEAWLKRMFWWVLPTAIVTLFVLLLVAASITRRRVAAKARKAAAEAAQRSGEGPA